MRARSLLVAAFVLVPINTVLAADATDKPTNATDCATLAATPATGTATDRFMREWCQRNASTAAPIVPSASIASSAPETATPPPAEPTPAPRYSNDDSADQLNSSRLPPGYHCHMLKFGERICHGGLD
ncbi:MAG: hypothetical protein IPP41_02565 [Rhodocyclaceae bacterium]|nr:hypothetical protein [Rhodocyclaceae bacterium]